MLRSLNERWSSFSLPFDSFVEEMEEIIAPGSIRYHLVLSGVVVSFGATVLYLVLFSLVTVALLVAITVVAG